MKHLWKNQNLTKKIILEKNKKIKKNNKKIILEKN